jgi:serine/threonine-protein kinase
VTPPLTPERWSQIEAICHAALQRNLEDRPAFLDEACAGDRDLRNEADSLLGLLAAEPEFLETPLLQLADFARADAGRREVQIADLGRYRVIRPLGHGGMGDVFLAVREGLDQHVALKVVRRGMDSDEVLRRFQQERQILASLHHPNIAHLLDGGVTADGRPYFVMEYVEGEPIDIYCDHHRLGIPDRLRLVTTVCAAVQHAHGHLVVHRDIKPGNILVTADGVPKLLDFGIGKVLSPTGDGGAETRSDVRLLTPEYASPEQVRGERVTTATDVHGLGVLLFRLLTGRAPFLTDGRSREELERAICTEEPPRPSRLAEGSSARRLAGDLDIIVLKALRKEPARRYASASALAEDLQRYLDGRPVAARPDTFRYRAAKFVRRNPWGVSAAAVAGASIAAFTVVTSLHSRQMERERDQALEVQGFLLESFGARGADQSPDAPLVARELLSQQAATLEFAYEDRPPLRAAMLQVLADANERLGLYDTAEPLAREALALRRRDPDAEAVDLAGALGMLGWIRVQQGALGEADSLLNGAVTEFRRAGPGGRRGLARALNDLGVLRQKQGDLDGAEAALREALEIRTRYFARDARAIGITANNVAAVHYGRGNYAEAAAQFERARDAMRRTLGPDHQRTAIAQSNLATIRSILGDWAAAEQELRALLERHTRVQGRGHPVTLRVMESLATALSYQGKSAEALPLAREALAAREGEQGPSHAQTGLTLRLLSTVLSASGAHDEAVATANRSLAILRGAYGPMHTEVGQALSVLARAERRRGQVIRANQLQREAIAVLDSVAGRGHPLAIAERVRLAEVLNQDGQYQEALTLLTEARIADRPPADGVRLATLLEMARSRLRLGQREAAESLLVVVEQALQPASAQSHRDLLATLRKELSDTR